MAAELLSVTEAARRLGVIPQRVRALIADGRLPAQLIGKRYVLDARVVDRFSREPRDPGRPLTAGNAWTLLALLARADVDVWSDRPRRSIGRLESLLNKGPDAVIAALTRSEPRAQIHRLRVLRADIERLAQNARLVKTGLSADAKAINIRYQRDRDGIDAYVSQTFLNQLESELRPIIGSHEANLVLRTPRGADWILTQPIAPLPVVAADLLPHEDSRVARSGREALNLVAS